MKNIGSFFQEVRSELSKIVWPTRDEFLGATTVALFVLFVSAVFLGTINHIFQLSAQKGFHWLVFGH